MSDLHVRLKATVEELHRELAAADSADPAVRELLVSALADIQRVMGSPQAAKEAEQGSALQSLRDAARHFEETHPSLAGAVGGVIDALGRMGI